MRAVVLESHGGTDVLQIAEIPPPEPGPEEVAVSVKATALNRADLLQRMGLYAGPKMPHEIPGLEFAGTVTAVGDRVETANVGDEVMGIVGGGAYAEQLTTHERMLLPIPASLDFDDAAAIPEVFITAFDALVLQGGMASGKTALVHAGASGVGTAAIQICKAIGAQIAVTCSTGKVSACERLGADAVIDYSTADFVEGVRELTAGRGADMVLDVIGGDYTNRNIDALAVNGRIIQVGLMGSGKADINLGGLLAKRASITGTTLRARPIEQKIVTSQRFVSEMLPLVADGRLRPVIDSRYPLDEIAAAHGYMESNANIGKILIDVAG